MTKSVLILFTAMIFNSVIPQKIPSVVSTVDLKRYMGMWYEIARLPNYFERKLKCASANYTLREFSFSGHSQEITGFCISTRSTIMCWSEILLLNTSGYLPGKRKWMNRLIICSLAKLWKTGMM